MCRKSETPIFFVNNVSVDTKISNGISLDNKTYTTQIADPVAIVDKLRMLIVGKLTNPTVK